MDLDGDIMSNDWEDLPHESDCAGSKYTVVVHRHDDHREVIWVAIDSTLVMELKEQYPEPSFKVTVDYTEEEFGEGYYHA
jgi:hypothetical protein